MHGAQVALDLFQADGMLFQFIMGRCLVNRQSRAHCFGTYKIFRKVLY